MKFVFEVYNNKFDPKKVLLIDRDGVVIKDTGYPHEIRNIKFMDENINKINLLTANAILICGFATNQSGVSRGFFSEKKFWSTHNYIISQCFKRRLKIDFTLVNFLKKRITLENRMVECLYKQ